MSPSNFQVDSLVYKEGFSVKGKPGRYPFLIPGETVDSESNVLEPSPYRVEPRCKYFSECGGCELQHISYEHQIELKEQMVRSYFEEAGVHIEFERLIPSMPYGVRRKITLHKGDDGATGFYRRGSKQIVPIDRCEMATPEVNSQIQNGKTQISESGLVKVPLFDKYLELPEGSFYQVQECANELLVEEVLQFADKEKVLDLYSGAGNFTFPLALLEHRVTAVELDKTLVNAAERGALELGVSKSICLYLKRVEKWLDENQISHYDLVIADPPRAGLGRAAKFLSDSNRLVLVSCDLKNAVRDIKTLTIDGRLEVKKCFAVDMFPQTSYVELVTYFERKA